MKIDSKISASSATPIVCMQQEGSEPVDNVTFAPFILINGACTALILFDFHFKTKSYLFEERKEEGWSGGGRDWNAIAQVIIAEQFPQLADRLVFDSDTSLFSISGTKADLTVLGHALKIAFDDDHILRDILFRAVLEK